MKYYYTIHHDNIGDLVGEGKMLIKSNQKSNDVISTQMKNKLALMNCKHRNFGDFGIGEWDGAYYNNLIIEGNLLSEPVFGMNIILEGSWAMEIGKTNSLCKAGTSFFYGTDQESNNSICVNESGTFSSINILFQNHYLQALSDRYPKCFSETCMKFIKGETTDFIEKSRQTTPEMLYIISQIKNAHLLGNASEVYTESKVLELLALQLQHAVGYHETSNLNRVKNIDDIEKVREARRLLLADLNQSPTISQLSKHVGINESKLKYGFKEVYNTTIHQYLFEHKMNLARKLLLDTGSTIFEIANQCGYDEPAHFSNAFKRKFGINPRDYRNQN